MMRTIKSQVGTAILSLGRAPTLRRLAAAVWIEDFGRRRHVWWPGQLRCPDRLTLQPHSLGLRFRLGIHWRTQPGEHLLEGIHGKHPTPADWVVGPTARPRGRRSVDLAGPPVRDLPASDGTRERSVGTSRRERPAATQSRGRARADRARRPEGSSPSPAGRGPLAPALPRGGSHATIHEAALAVASLLSLTGVAYQEAAQTLRAMAERATSRRAPRRGRGSPRPR